MPDLTHQEKKKLIRSINKNIGRTIFELFSPDDFSQFAQKAKITGPGFKTFKSAVDLNQPIILVSGHYGNYDVVRAKLRYKNIEVAKITELHVNTITKVKRHL